MDGDERRGINRRSSDANTEMNTSQPEPSDEELAHNDTAEQSMEPQGTSITEGASAHDITQSSMSVSEGEGDCDLEGIAGRVAELEELLQSKEAVVEALGAEIDHLTAEPLSPNSSQNSSHSHNSTSQYRDILLVYHTKLQEYERAVNQRDNLIQDLTASLEQALSARDALKAQLQSMSSNLSLPPNMGNCTTAQDQITSLQNVLSEHKSIIDQLNAELARSNEHARKLEMEKQAQEIEINDYKSRVNQLNEQIRVGAVENTINIAETMEMQKQYEARVDKIKRDMQVILEKFTSETNSKTLQHENAMKELEGKYQRELIEMKGRYDEQYRNLADRFNQELPDLESKHAKELSVFQAQLSSYKKTVETLKRELLNRSESQQSIIAETNSLKEKLLHTQKEKQMMSEQISLHKVQLEELTSKYVAAASILDSKESIERSLEEALTNVAMLKQENDVLKFKYDDLSARYAAAQSLIENNQLHERSMSTRIFDLEKSLSRVSGVSVSTLSEFNETTYQTFDDVALQFHMTRQKLDEKMELERQLVDKIRTLENEVFRANEELDRANLEKESYEKQLKDMKNTCDKMRSDMSNRQDGNSSTPQLFQSSIYFGTENSGKSTNQSIVDADYKDIIAKIDMYEREMKNLKDLLQLKDKENTDLTTKLREVMDKFRETEAECEQLKSGLATAWEQCALFEEKLNQTLAMNETRFTDSLGVSRNDPNIEGSNNSYKTSNETFNKSNIKSEDRESSNEFLDATSMMHEIASLRNEKEGLLKEVRHLSDTVSNFEEISKKLDNYCTLAEKLQSENNNLLEENKRLSKDKDLVESLNKKIVEMTAEKSSLVRELTNIADKHREELAAVRADSMSEVEKLRNLLFTVREGDAGLEQLKNELDTRHAKEMEELRTYFEEKCLQMEKQYSEEIFSQQSKKMSDNDSEIDDLGDDLFFGGGGDCANAGRSSVENSRAEVSFADGEYKNHKIEKNANVASSIVSVVDRLCQTEWDSALENGELTKLRAAYSNQLEEQVALAKLDIVNALQEQIQALLAVESEMEDNWPPELLQLRNKFTNNAKREIEELKSLHATELKQLREEHSRSVARIIERHQEEVSKIATERLPKNKKGTPENCDNTGENSTLIRERDNLFKTCVTLKELIVDLIKYFAVCEEELNNTLISEVLKRPTVPDVDLSTTNPERDTIQHEIDSTDLAASPKLPVTKIKRVHFAPQCTQITSIINNDSDIFQSLVETEDNVTHKLRQELDTCLKRMKSESAQVLGISLTPGESMLDTLSKQVLWTTKVNEELSAKLSEAENVIAGYQEETRLLKMKIVSLQQNLLSVESKKEIVSEGYGEHEESAGDLVIQDFSQLQDKARHAIMSGTGDSAYLLQLIEELCRYNDKLTDETRKDKEDLQQQVPLEPTPTPCIHRVSHRKIEAADKQLRAIRKFLEEQASEREIERDDAARQIHALQEQVKEREREKERDLRMTSESPLSPVSSPVGRVLEATDINAAVEALESQLREMSSLMMDLEAKKSETESELKVAVDKIWVLRDIIVDLEQQIQGRIEKEESLLNQIEQLEEVIAAQTKNQQELAQELDSMKMGGENSQLNDHITHLEEELRKHKLSSEHFNVNSSALKQIKTELREMQNHLDKRTKELETLHMCGSNLSISQPSEDVSIRDQIDVTRCPTPDDPNAPPTLPLDQLLKLKEKMLKHARAEEVAFKRIKDLDMQLSTLKIQNEELQAEQEILQQTASEQLFQMEAMRGRLEQQKQSAPFAQRQATSRLELQLHEANAKLHSLEQAVDNKELEINEIKAQLQRANQLLQEKQKEFTNVMQTENNAIQELKDRLQTLEEEKKCLESKVGVQERAQIKLPQLIDTMLADKNEEIDHLKEQLSKRDKQLQVYLSQNIDDNQLAKQSEPKNSARTLSDILSIHSECEEYSEAIRDSGNMGHVQSHNISSFKGPTLSGQMKESLQSSPAPVIDTSKAVIHVPRLELGISHSQSFSSTCPRHSRVSLDLMHTDFDLKSPSSGDCTESPTNHTKSNGVSGNEVGCTCEQNQSAEKTEKISSPSKQSKTPVLSSKSTISIDNQSLNKQIQDLENQLKAIQEELRSKSSTLNKREIELNALQRNLEELQVEFKDTVESLTRDKDFYKNQYELSQASEGKIRRDLEEVENTLKLQTEELEEYKHRIQVNERILSDMNTENARLKQTVEAQIEINKTYERTLIEKSEELKSLQQSIFDKDVTIESVQTRNLEIENENKQLYEYKTKYDQCRKDLADAKNETKRLTDGLNNRDQIIRRLEEMARRTSLSGSLSPGDNKDQEIHHLQEYLKEKEKVIRQMSDDSKSLHRALETIQNKMKESGNVVELRQKLKEERRFNAELKDMVEKLKQELESLKDESMRQSVEGADIEDMVQRELNLSARLDQQIMNVIESESEETTPRKIEKHSCNSLTIKPAEHDRMERVMQKYTEIKHKLKQANKTNEDLMKLKDDLEIEREMLKTQIAEYENRIFQLTSDLDEKCKKVSELDGQLSSKRSHVRSLEAQLHKEKHASHTAQMHDSVLISQLRIKLLASLDGEEQVRKDLTILRQEHKNLETQLSSVKAQIESQKPGEPSSLTELLKEEQTKYVIVAEKYEKEQRNNAELRDSLRTLETQKNRYEKQLDIAIEEQEKLVSSLALTEGVKEHLEIDLKRTKEELKSREEECEWLHKRIKTLTEASTKRQQHASDEQTELKSLRRGMSNAREVIIDLESDMKQLKGQLIKSEEERAQLSQWVQNLTDSENVLKKKLEAVKEEEERLKEVVADMQNDLQLSVKRELELTEELQKERFSSEKNVPAKFVQKIKELNDSIDKHSHDKSVLHEKLVKAREEKEQYAMRVRDLESQLALKSQEAITAATGHLSPHMAEKLQHFYGKYLRVESRRKALAYQKQYLLCIIGSYQISEENTLSILAQFTHEQRSYTLSSDSRKKSKVRFRSAALVIISIHRMKWMILRWRTGRRVGANAVLGSLDHSYVPFRRTASNHSPPVRDRTTAMSNGGAQGGFGLEHYLHRFMDIQQTLGLAMAEPETGPLISD